MAIARFLRKLTGGAEARAPQPEPGTVVYAVGDIHGCSAELDRLEALIVADVERHAPSLKRVIVYLGDYVDRGPDSKGVVQRLVERGDGHVFLRGNHDAEMLRVLDDPAALSAWRAIGGLETLASYGMPPPPINPSAADMAAFLAQFREKVPPAHIAFLKNLAPSWRSGGLFFAHAGVRPGLPIDAQSEHDLMWIREPFLSSTRNFGAFVVHGHSSGYTIDMQKNRLCVDTGAYATGRLSAAVFDGGPVRVLTTHLPAARR